MVAGVVEMSVTEAIGCLDAGASRELTSGLYRMRTGLVLVVSMVLYVLRSEEVVIFRWYSYVLGKL